MSESGSTARDSDADQRASMACAIQRDLEMADADSIRVYKSTSVHCSVEQHIAFNAMCCSVFYSVHTVRVCSLLAKTSTRSRHERSELLHDTSYDEDGDV